MKLLLIAAVATVALSGVAKAECQARHSSGSLGKFTAALGGGVLACAAADAADAMNPAISDPAEVCSVLHQPNYALAGCLISRIQATGALAIETMRGAPAPADGDRALLRAASESLGRLAQEAGDGVDLAGRYAAPLTMAALFASQTARVAEEALAAADPDILRTRIDEAFAALLEMERNRFLCARARFSAKPVEGCSPHDDLAAPLKLGKALVEANTAVQDGDSDLPAKIETLRQAREASADALQYGTKIGDWRAIIENELDPLLQKAGALPTAATPNFSDPAVFETLLSRKNPDKNSIAAAEAFIADRAHRRLEAASAAETARAAQTADFCVLVRRLRLHYGPDLAEGDLTAETEKIIEALKTAETLRCPS